MDTNERRTKGAAERRWLRPTHSAIFRLKGSIAGSRAYKWRWSKAQKLKVSNVAPLKRRSSYKTDPLAWPRSPRISDFEAVFAHGRPRMTLIFRSRSTALCSYAASSQQRTFSHYVGHRERNAFGVTAFTSSSSDAGTRSASRANTARATCSASMPGS